MKQAFIPTLIGGTFALIIVAETIAVANGATFGNFALPIILWVIIEAVEEERAEIVGCLAELEKADGAILHWQLDDKKFAVMLKRGLIRMEGDCLVHPRARKITELAFTMVHPTDMRVLYRADNEGPAIMLLNQLIANFNVGGGWQHRCNEEDMRHELDSRGWYSGLHDNGHYLVLNLHLMQLEPHPDHPRNETIR